MNASSNDQDATLFEQLGGEDRIRELVGRFYALMDELPEAYVVRKLHPDSLHGSERKLFEYLCGWLGGPPYYEEKYGHPRMRARHMPFAIGVAERDAWLLCMNQAVAETLPAGAARAQFLENLRGLADWMRNREG